MNQRNQKLFILVECAAMIALSTVLSLVKVVQMPLGGSVTLFSMLPVCFISIRHGMKWGLGSAFIYSVGQFFLGGSLGWGLDLTTLVICALLDYIIAYTVLGLSGMFAKKGSVGIVSGTVMAVTLRFVCHFLSGVTIWKRLKPWELFGKTFENMPVLYSFCYNGFYMIPEIVFTTVAMILLIKIPVIKKLLIKQ